MQWLAAAVAALSLMMVVALAYHQGLEAGGHAATEAALEKRGLDAKASRLEDENTALNAKVAELEMARRLDREAYSQIERTLGDLQSRLSRQGDDLAFYRSIVSPEDGVQGLRMQRLEVTPGGEPREYVLKLTLIQAMRHDSEASGLAQVVIHGSQEGRPARYSVGELLGKPRAQLPFSFRYFQTLEQPVTLPERFEPFEVEVQLRSSKLAAPLKQSYPWKTAGAAIL
jgi:hypothetical protein